MNSFGTQEYAREELRAEIASMMLGAELQIGHDPGQHLAYVDSWIKILTEKPFEIHQAASDSQKIMDYLMAFDRKKELIKGAEKHPVQEMANQPEDKEQKQELVNTLKFGR
tara:strand:+ start:83 stop:415 length:333 start_codon:yes stop_codon:yes gene_type:complete